MPIPQADALAKYPGAIAFRYGDGPELNAEILALVRSGKKTVSCDAIANFEARGEALPKPDRIDVALDWDGNAVLAVRTVAVDVIAFDKMSEDLITDQAEFRDLAHWRVGYEAYLRRAGVFAPDAPMLVERFEVVEEFTTAAKAGRP